ncbi:hypothetical protein [Eoetvoesiella caeni]|uniref:Uncharacterized protein n=1 Tax=Eoetvoesiella caeni TaxID=645616 RepID=A0A366GZQ4_9BURK|nr:hypothetical protein [Eoetvoesiella caeni]MCI2811303.1 hypothetical protein [Eoetvoesiella caeni]NYT57198.1 hypothetical protein [Eoetvoesiella caeni]RBP33629.1 hypothetical protein DFR37_12620 [Eoetvoesiella caeni]
MGNNKTQSADNTHKWALAGEIVTSSKRANKILAMAIAQGTTYLVPQARNVAIKLRAAGK